VPLKVTLVLAKAYNLILRVSRLLQGEFSSWITKSRRVCSVCNSRPHNDVKIKFCVDTLFV
jgi:hypothetical protein